MPSKHLSVLILSFLLGFAVPQAGAAGMSVDAEATIRDFVTQRLNSPVALRLASGEELAGVVQSVGKHLVHLKNLKGREFYDAIVPIEKIDAVVVRNR